MILGELASQAHEVRLWPHHREQRCLRICQSLQHLMYGDGAYQASELVENDYAKIANAMGCGGIRVEHPDELGPAIERGLAHKTVGHYRCRRHRDPAKMLPGVDNRTVTVKKGDRVA